MSDDCMNETVGSEGDEEPVIRRTGEESLELNHLALTRIGNNWPEEAAAFAAFFAEIASSTADQMNGGEHDSRDITITVYMRAEDMSPEQGAD